MRLASFGLGLLIGALLFHWIWLGVFGAALIIVGVMFSYKRPQDDPVWQMLVQAGVIDDDEGDPITDDAYRNRVCRCGHKLSDHYPRLDAIECEVCDGNDACEDFYEPTV